MLKDPESIGDNDRAERRLFVCASSSSPGQSWPKGWKTRRSIDIVRCFR